MPILGGRHGVLTTQRDGRGGGSRWVHVPLSKKMMKKKKKRRKGRFRDHRDI